MRVSDAKALVGKVCTLDMIIGVRLTTKVTGVAQEEGRWFLETGPLIVFVLEMQGQDQKTGAFNLQLRQVIPYGIPEFEPQKKNSIDLEHVVMAGPCQMDPVVQQYTKMTSTIVTAPANAPLPSMDTIAAAMKKIQGTP
jgi:hypothetical protein